ncbi:MAG: hypothetical protein QOI41_2882, partial [Myxococcales bacterium]|nr:hypothetical protein [Myxococcales bacterium]
MRSSEALVLLVLTTTTALACSRAPAPAPSPASQAASAPSAAAAGPRASSAPTPDAASADAAAIATLAKTPGTSFAGLWLRRLAAAWATTHDATAPEVELAARELHRAVQWGSLDEELQILGSAATVAPAFENTQVPVAVHAAKSVDPQRDYGSAITAATAARRPRLVAIFAKLGADGRRHMLLGMRDPATIADFFAVAARDGVCPSVKDDRDLSWEAWSSPSSASCAPPPLPADELHDLDRLSAELADPWPRAVRAIVALRELRDHERARFKPDLAQQKHFVEGCMMHPMCPLWLIDKPDPGLRPVLEEAS